MKYIAVAQAQNLVVLQRLLAESESYIHSLRQTAFCGEGSYESISEGTYPGLIFPLFPVMGDVELYQMLCLYQRTQRRIRILGQEPASSYVQH